MRREIDEIKEEQALQENRINILLKQINKIEQRLLNLSYIINNKKDEKNKYDHLEEKEIDENLMKVIKEEICLICLQNYNNQDKIISLTCTHFFHASCIKKWLEMKNICPLCKKFISFTDI